MKILFKTIPWHGLKRSCARSTRDMCWVNNTRAFWFEEFYELCVLIFVTRWGGTAASFSWELLVRLFHSQCVGIAQKRFKIAPLCTRPPTSDVVHCRLKQSCLKIVLAKSYFCKCFDFYLLTYLLIYFIAIVVQDGDFAPSLNTYTYKNRKVLTKCFNYHIN